MRTSPISVYFETKALPFQPIISLLGLKLYLLAYFVQVVGALYGNPGVEVPERKGFSVRARGVSGNIDLFRAVFFYPFYCFFGILIGFITEANNYVGKKGKIFEASTEFRNDCVHSIHFMQAVHIFQDRMGGGLNRKMEEFENLIRVEGIHKIVQDREDGKGVHHPDPHFEVAGDFRDHAQEFREFDTCIHAVLAVVLGGEPDFPAALCNCGADVFYDFLRRERAELAPCILYDTVGAGEVAALGDLADMNIWV